MSDASKLIQCVLRCLSVIDSYGRAIYNSFLAENRISCPMPVRSLPCSSATSIPPFPVTSRSIYPVRLVPDGAVQPAEASETPCPAVPGPPSRPQTRFPCQVLYTPAGLSVDVRSPPEPSTAPPLPSWTVDSPIPLHTILWCLNFERINEIQK